MDYFTDLLATFLDLDRGDYIAVYGRVGIQRYKNILIWGLTGLEWYEGE